MLRKRGAAQQTGRCNEGAAGVAEGASDVAARGERGARAFVYDNGMFWGSEEMEEQIC